LLWARIKNGGRLFRMFSGNNWEHTRTSSEGVLALRSLSSYLLAIPKRYPFRFACIFTSFKTCSADILVQKFMEGAENVNWRRCAVFSTFGFFYQGAFQYIVLIHIVAKRLLPNAAKYAALPIREKIKDLNGSLQLLAQVGIANFIMDPFFCLPTYYITKEAILGGMESTAESGQNRIKNALLKYKENAQEDLITSWKIWIPAHFVNFGELSIFHSRKCYWDEILMTTKMTIP